MRTVVEWWVPWWTTEVIQRKVLPLGEVLRTPVILGGSVVARLVLILASSFIQCPNGLFCADTSQGFSQNLGIGGWLRILEYVFCYELW